MEKKVLKSLKRGKKKSEKKGENMNATDDTDNLILPPPYISFNLSTKISSLFTIFSPLFAIF